MSDPREVGLLEALTRGVALVRRAPRVVALAVLVDVVDGAFAFLTLLCLGALGLATTGRLLALMTPLDLFQNPDLGAEVWLDLFFLQRSLLPLAGAWLVATLLVLALRLCWVSAGATAFSLLNDPGGSREPGPVWALAGTRLHRALLTSALTVPLEIASWLYGLAAVGAAGTAYLVALDQLKGVPFRAVLLALALTLFVAVRGLASFLSRLSLLRAVGGDLGPVDAVAGAFRVLVAQPGLLLGLWFLFGLGAGLASLLGGAGGAVVMGTSGAALALGVLLRLASGLLGVALAAVVGTAELGAYASLEAGLRGALPPLPPPPAPPEPLLAAEPILATEVLATQVLGTEVLSTAVLSTEVLSTEVVAPAAPAEVQSPAERIVERSAEQSPEQAPAQKPDDEKPPT